MAQGAVGGDYSALDSASWRLSVSNSRLRGAQYSRSLRRSSISSKNKASSTASTLPSRAIPRRGRCPCSPVASSRKSLQRETNSSGVRSSLSQNSTLAESGSWSRLLKKSASKRRRIIGQSLSRCVFFALTRSGIESRSQTVPSGSSIVARLCQINSNGSTPLITDITSTRNPSHSGCRHLKCTACPFSRYATSKGGTAMTPARSSVSAPRNLSKFSASARMAKSESLLNSAAP